MPRRIGPELDKLDAATTEDAQEKEMPAEEARWTPPERRMLSREERDLLAALRKNR
jgi:hypothetical protein